MKDLKENWNRMAERYERFTNNSNSYSMAIEWPAIKSLVPDLTDRRVVDLGCGTGSFTFLLEEFRPREIIGIDLSEKMIQLATHKANQIKSKAHFLVGDITDLTSIPRESVDFVFSSTTLHYVPKLLPFFRQVSQILQPKGEGIFSVIHPVYSAHYPLAGSEPDAKWEVRYLDKEERAYVQPWVECDPEEENFLSFSYHHTFSDYLNAITACGLGVEQVVEPSPPSGWEKDKPRQYRSYIKTPTFLIIKARKGCAKIA